jgi:hypothetical protein
MLQIFGTSADRRPNMYFRKRPIFIAKSMPYFRMMDRSSGGNPAFLVSIPSMNRMINPFMSIN